MRWGGIGCGLVVLACGLYACSGKIDGHEGAGPGENPAGNGAPGSSGSSGAQGSHVPPGTNPGGVEITCPQDAVPGLTPLTKLSTAEYKNTVRDLLTASGVGATTTRIADALDSVPDDSLGESFRALDNRISLEHVQAYFNVGVAVGDAIAGDPAVLSKVAGDCAMQSTLAKDCAQAFIERFVTLAYRNPPSAEEVASLAVLNDGTRTPAEAVRAIAIVAMSSPRFVNHVEIDGDAIGGADDLLQLTGYEIASRLSYLFWQTMPDAELFAAAEDGSLETENGFAAQLDRVFDDPRTRETLWQFWNEWLRLEKFTGFESTRPGFESLAAGESVGEPGHDHYADMVQEIRDLTELFTFERSATLADLLGTGESVTQSADLASLYGVEPWSGKGAYPTLPDGTRAGLFQRAALLVSSLETTNPFHRGAFVRKTLLCDPLMKPDPNTLPPNSLTPPPITADQTTRERFEAKVKDNPTCASCHFQFSNIGFVLESFDALGRYRQKERVFDEESGEQLAELSIDTTAVPRVRLEDESEVKSAAELNQRIIDSEKAEACLATKYFSFTLHREPMTDTLDSCTIEDLARSLKDPQAGLEGAFKRIARHAVFFVRKVGPQ